LNGFFVVRHGASNAKLRLRVRLQIFISLLGLLSCNSRQQPADLVVYNATVYQVDSAFSKAEAFAVRNGRIVLTGSSAEVRGKFRGAQEVDAGGNFIYPGFYDAHCHFYRYALGLREANLVAAKSWAEVLARLRAHRRQRPHDVWLLGHGWDQNDWPGRQFPTKDSLDQLFPDVPVYLTRIDGHAALANQKALDLAGITSKTLVPGGSIGHDAQGQPTGLLVDNAKALVARLIPAPTAAEATQFLRRAEQECLALGLTSLADAGLDKIDIERIDSLQKAGQLHLRLNCMVSATPANLDYYLQRGLYNTDFLTVNSFKVYADGALGSRGACLLAPYSDSPHERGFLLQSAATYRELARRIAASPFQMNTHAIGDSANRLLLDICGVALRGQRNRRWRIEHAQVVTAADVAKFGRFGLVPSIQPAHATSDMYWADARLGAARLKTAYAYKALLASAGRVALGSDFPVEYLNPLFGFHAAVARQDGRNYPSGGFQMENALSREQALRGMTEWAAWAGFEEKQKGRLERGLWADFVVLDKDLLTAPKEELRGVQVLQTWIAGKQVFQK
jgi:predicted amidohydrolase YtcJ